MALLPQTFEALNTDGTLYWSGVEMKWAPTGATITLSSSHPTEGTQTWKLSGASLILIGTGSGFGTPTVIDLSSVTSLSLDVYVESIFSGGSVSLEVANDDASETATASTTTDGTGAFTLTVDLTPLSGTRADTTIAVYAFGAAVFYIDNLRDTSATADETADLAATEAPDTASFSATVSPTAALAATEAPDTTAFVVTVGNVELASLAATEAPDVAAFSASVVHTSALDATEAPDTASFTATITDAAVITGGGGSHWRGPRKPEYRIHPEYDDEPSKPARPVPVETGIVIVPEPIPELRLGPIAPALNIYADLQRNIEAAARAEQARRERLQAIIKADDDWLAFVA